MQQGAMGGTDDPVWDEDRANLDRLEEVVVARHPRPLPYLASNTSRALPGIAPAKP